ncbi:MAG: zinc-ribbon domain-containing protein [Nitrospinae bacterium]|nr:zinc-ribbon domain-containing protein [Nitrospinota bacterium]
MNVTCGFCNTVFRVDDAKIPPAGAKVRCPSCKNISAVKKPDFAAPAQTPPSAAQVVQAKPAPAVRPQPAPPPPPPAVRKPPAPAPSAPPVPEPGVEEELQGGAGDSVKNLEISIKNIQRGLAKVPGQEAEGLKSEAKNLVKNYQGIKKEMKDLESSIKEMETLVNICKAITSILDMDELLNMIMDNVINVMNAERGFLMLKDDATGDLMVKVARNMESEMKDQRLHTISSSITSKVASEKKPVLTTDAKSDERFSQQASVMGYGLRSLLCVPLMVKEKVLGVIYIDNRMLAGAFNERSVDLLMTFSSQAAIAIENAKLYNNVQKETKARANLQRYLSPNLVEDILKKKESLVLGGEKIEVSVLFSDICGFTSMSEKMQPEDIVAMLNEYFTIMTKIIFKRHGTLDKFVGDAIMAIFGAPIFHPQSPMNAVRAAFEMQAALRELNKKWSVEGKTTFNMRIGVNTGVVVAGNIGAEDRMDYTVIGDNVNLASRLESNAQPGKVLISQSTYEKVKDGVAVKKLEPIKVKGKSDLIHVYEVEEITAAAEETKFQRKQNRREANCYATFYIEGSTQVFQGTITNISAGGFGLNTRTASQAGQRLFIDFDLGGGIKFEKLQCSIATARMQKDDAGSNYYLIGAAFQDIPSSAREKIEHFISSQ